MILTAAQIRSARSLLRWTAPTITKRSKVAFATVLKAQLDAEIQFVCAADLPAIRATFEAAGVEFTAEGVEPGMKLRRSRT